MTAHNYARRARIAETEIAHQRKQLAAATFAEDRAAIEAHITHLEAVFADAQARQVKAGHEMPVAA